MCYRVFLKRYLNSNTVNLEYFNNWILFFGNKITREIKQIAAEREPLFIEYKIQTEKRGKHEFTYSVTYKTYFAPKKWK